MQLPLSKAKNNFINKNAAALEVIFLHSPPSAHREQ